MSFYTENTDRAILLAQGLKQDGWDYDDIRSYFASLEDPFFANWVITELKKSEGKVICDNVRT
jgi:hypothetical protein